MTLTRRKKKIRKELKEFWKVNPGCIVCGKEKNFQNSKHHKHCNDCWDELSFSVGSHSFRVRTVKGDEKDGEQK